jgi:hypothetical protein
VACRAVRVPGWRGLRAPCGRGLCRGATQAYLAAEARVDAGALEGDGLPRAAVAEKGGGKGRMRREDAKGG